eukprot:51910-Amphidinium_carterae.1
MSLEETSCHNVVHVNESFAMLQLLGTQSKKHQANRLTPVAVGSRPWPRALLPIWIALIHEC